MNSLVPESWQESVSGLRDRVVRSLDRWRRRPKRGLDGAECWPAMLTDAAGPAITMEETGEELRVTAGLPGLSGDDFRVEVENRRLILRGEKKASHERREDGWHYLECSYGSFYRAIPLPCEIEADKAEARYKHGMLRVRLPKSEAGKAAHRRITIH